VTPEIRAFEFALGLFSVLIGLSIADVATSLHRLIRKNEVVRWDPLTLLAALFALLMIIGMWFDLWGIRNATSVRSFFFYMALVAAFFILFLIAASSLPDEAAGPVDLRSYYDANRRYFWLLVTLFQVIYVGFGFHFIAGIIAHEPMRLLAIVLVQWGLLIIVPAILTLVRSRPVHYVGLIVLFAVDLWHYAPYSIN
jgi:uncharacterized membrane protein